MLLELSGAVLIASPVVQFATGAAGSSVIAVAAYRRRVLTRSGAWTAAAIGTILYGAGGWAWAALIGAFFVTSSTLTRLDSIGTRQRIRSRDRSGRMWRQVLANGGVATLTALGHSAIPSPFWLVACAGAVAVATADTWATEIGRFSPSSPRLLTTWRPTEVGASGGITNLGIAAGCGGALLVAVVGAPFALPPRSQFVLAVALAGVSGSFVDSLLGATMEQRWRWIDNDIVNLIATVWGSLVAVLLQR